jgi:CheY-like chemotaxis protein
MMNTRTARPREGRPLEVLLVEDAQLDAAVTRDAIQTANVAVHVHHVRDGEEALDFLFQRGVHAQAPRPDVVVLDLHLPRRDGMEVLSEIRAAEPLRSLPVAILTRSEADHDRLRSYALRANGYFIKPPDHRLVRFVEMADLVEDCWVSIEQFAE